MIHKGRMTPAQIRAVIADAKVRGIVGLHFCPLCGTPFTAAQPACVSCLPEWQEPPHPSPLALVKTHKKNPDRNGFFRWTVEVEVHKNWVEDGFDLYNTEYGCERAPDWLAHDLGYANGAELRAKVLTSPPDEAVAEVQGYPNAGAMRKERHK